TLPGMSGIDVVDALRRDPEQGGCVLNATSGHGRKSVSSPSPFDRYFTRPLDIVSLVAYLFEIQTRQEPPSWTPAVPSDRHPPAHGRVPQGKAHRPGTVGSDQARTPGGGFAAAWDRCRAWTFQDGGSTPFPFAMSTFQFDPATGDRRRAGTR